MKYKKILAHVSSYIYNDHWRIIYVYYLCLKKYRTNEGSFDHFFSSFFSFDFFVARAVHRLFEIAEKIAKNVRTSVACVNNKLYRGSRCIITRECIFICALRYWRDRWTNAKEKRRPTLIDITRACRANLAGVRNDALFIKQLLDVVNVLNIYPWRFPVVIPRKRFSAEIRL